MDKQDKNCRSILVVMGRYPWPLNDGWKIRTFNLIKWMSLTGYTIDIITYIDIDQHLVLDGLSKYCRNIFHVKRKTRYKLGDLLRGFVSKTPFPVLNYYSNEMFSLILDIVNKNNYDLIQVEDG